MTRDARDDLLRDADVFEVSDPVKREIRAEVVRGTRIKANVLGAVERLQIAHRGRSVALGGNSGEGEGAR